MEAGPIRARRCRNHRPGIRLLRDHLHKIRNSGLHVKHVLLVGGSADIRQEAVAFLC